MEGVQTLGQMIRELRGDRSRASFAALYGVTRQSVEQWETGQTKPSSTNLELMGIKVTYRLNGDLDPTASLESPIVSSNSKC